MCCVHSSIAGHTTFLHTRTKRQFRTILQGELKLWGNCVNFCKTAAYQWFFWCWSLCQLYLGEERVQPWDKSPADCISVSISGFCPFISGFIYDMMNELNSRNLATCGWSHAFLKWLCCSSFAEKHHICPDPDFVYHTSLRTFYWTP